SFPRQRPDYHTGHSGRNSSANRSLTCEGELSPFNDQPETKLDIRLAARLLKHLIETGVIYHPLELT
ncbi:MAG TPA: hypothetical protein VNO18_22530, partial [Xanthobacteraceae bacterium]|nr:hypothetical protein [Xanthobacteraceae bacterium]